MTAAKEGPDARLDDPQALDWHQSALNGHHGLSAPSPPSARTWRV